MRIEWKAQEKEMSIGWEMNRWERNRQHTVGMERIEQIGKDRLGMHSTGNYRIKQEQVGPGKHRIVVIIGKNRYLQEKKE